MAQKIWTKGILIFFMAIVICTLMILSPVSLSGETWTQKAVIPLGVRDLTVGFSISTKGYIGTGASPSLRKDFREYDPAVNTWTQ